MILGRDTHPEKTAYYLGGRVLEAMKQCPKNGAYILEVFHKVNEGTKVSMASFMLALDWLFLLGAIDCEKGVIRRCS